MAAPVRVLFRLPLSALSMDEVVQLCAASVQSRQRVLVGVVNAAKVVKLRHDDQLRDSLLKCDVLVADGQSVVWASRVLRKQLPQRVAGIDLFERLLQVAERDGRSIYLLGAKAEVLAVLQRRLTNLFPGLSIAGARDGYFDVDDSGTIATEIRASHADMLFLGMPSPKKEIFLGDYADQLGVPVLHGVGGSFDILAGVTRRAPMWWQRMGLEWLYRLLQEPRRLAPRYLTTNSAFIWLTLKELLRPQLAYHAGNTSSALEAQPLPKDEGAGGTQTYRTS